MNEEIEQNPIEWAVYFGMICFFGIIFLYLGSLVPREEPGFFFWNIFGIICFAVIILSLLPRISRRKNAQNY